MLFYLQVNLPLDKVYDILQLTGVGLAFILAFLAYDKVESKNFKKFAIFVVVMMILGTAPVVYDMYLGSNNKFLKLRYEFCAQEFNLGAPSGPAILNSRLEKKWVPMTKFQQSLYIAFDRCGNSQ